jgi:hypothetical protein
MVTPMFSTPMLTSIFAGVFIVIGFSFIARYYLIRRGEQPEGNDYYNLYSVAHKLGAAALLVAAVAAVLNGSFAVAAMALWMLLSYVALGYYMPVNVSDDEEEIKVMGVCSLGAVPKPDGTMPKFPGGGKLHQIPAVVAALTLSFMLVFFGALCAVIACFAG